MRTFIKPVFLALGVGLFSPAIAAEKWALVRSTPSSGQRVVISTHATLASSDKARHVHKALSRADTWVGPGANEVESSLVDGAHTSLTDDSSSFAALGQDWATTNDPARAAEQTDSDGLVAAEQFVPQEPVYEPAASVLMVLGLAWLMATRRFRQT